MLSRRSALFAAVAATAAFAAPAFAAETETFTPRFMRRLNNRIRPS